MSKRKKRTSNTSPKKKKKQITISIIILLLISGGLCYYFLIYKGEKLELKLPIVEQKKLTIIDENSHQRPIAVMIDNNVGNQQHIGLQEAYLSYEAIVEGGLSRIMAVYKDQDVKVIGPVRSARHYFLDYALENDALYAHFGWSPYAENDIKSLGVNNINGLYVDFPYWRDKTVAAPHNVFTSIEKLYHSATDLKYQTTSSQWKNLNYTTDPVDLTKFKNQQIKCSKEKKEAGSCNENPDLITALEVVIPYSYSQVRSYTYDKERDVYLRFMNGKAHTDRQTQEQYHYKNIIVLKVSNHSLDSSGRQDLDTTGSGDGYYITGGYALPITWHKKSRGGKTTYTYKDGTSVKIKDGNTFVQIEPSNQETSFGE